MIKDILKQTLLASIEKLDSGNCNISDDEMIEVIEMMQNFNTDRALSKEQACEYMEMSRSTFDYNVKIGLIPKGKKKLGFKELQWSQADLDICKEKLKSR